MAISKFQKFDMIKLKRSEVEGAPYNPRKITEKAEKKLKANLKNIGLLEPLVVNKQSNGKYRLVSGHRRLSILDTLEKNQDYELNYSLVELDEKTEKSQNVFFNNYNAQGEYDDEKFLELLHDIDFDFEMAGFDSADMQIFDFEEAIEIEEEEEVFKDLEEVKKAAKATKERRKEYKQEQEKINSGEFYLCIIFKDNDQKRNILEQLNISNGVDDSYISAEMFLKIINKHNSLN